MHFEGEECLKVKRLLLGWDDVVVFDFVKCWCFVDLFEENEVFGHARAFVMTPTPLDNKQIDVKQSFYHCCNRFLSTTFCLFFKTDVEKFLKVGIVNMHHGISFKTIRIFNGWAKVPADLHKLLIYHVTRFGKYCPSLSCKTFCLHEPFLEPKIENGIWLNSSRSLSRKQRWAVR